MTTTTIGNNIVAERHREVEDLKAQLAALAKTEAELKQRWVEQTAAGNEKAAGKTSAQLAKTRETIRETETAIGDAEAVLEETKRVADERKAEQRELKYQTVLAQLDDMVPTIFARLDDFLREIDAFMAIYDRLTLRGKEEFWPRHAAGPHITAPNDWRKAALLKLHRFIFDEHGRRRPEFRK